MHTARSTKITFSTALPWEVYFQVHRKHRPKQTTDAIWTFLDAARCGESSFLCQNYYQMGQKKRTRVADSITSVSRRNYSIKYFLFAENDVKVRVCKAFYLTTLDISRTRVAYFHSNTQQSSLPHESQKGRHRVVSDLSKQLKDNIRNHINSILQIASHYCRARTSKEYVEGSLNLSRLYATYVEKSTAEGSDIAKESMYREIFNHEFNIVSET